MNTHICNCMDVDATESVGPTEPFERGAQSERGSVTLESVIIAHIVFMSVCLCVYMLLLLFEHAQLQSASGYTATAVSAKWRGLSEGAAGGGGGSGGDTRPADGAGLYHRLVDLTASDKQAVASAVAGARSRNTRLNGMTETEIAAAYESGLLGKSLTLSINGVVTFPNPAIMSTFGLDSSYGEVFGAKSMMPDYAESIRTVDYVMEIEQKIEEASPEFQKVAQSFRDMLAHIRSYIGGIL